MNSLGTRILPAALAAAVLWAAPTLTGASARHVEVTDDSVVEIATKVRYTTVIVVPEDESILTFVCGDSEYWGLEGKANVALLKPMKEGIRTNVALITDLGRIYTLTAAEGGEPDLKIYLHPQGREPDGPQLIGTPLEAPRFVAASELADYERQAELARDQAREAKRAAQELLEQGIEDFRRATRGRCASTTGCPPRRPPTLGTCARCGTTSASRTCSRTLPRRRPCTSRRRADRQWWRSTTRTGCTWRGTWSGSAGCRSASAG